MIKNWGTRGAFGKAQNALLCLIFASAAVLIGCGSQKGKTVFTAGPNSGDVVGTAPDTGTYALYTSMSPNPTLTVGLKQGDKLGFRKTSDGKIEAVWQDQHHDFDKGTAQVYWKLQ